MDKSTLVIKACLFCFLLSTLMLLVTSCDSQDYASNDPVGQISPQRYITPVNQILTPVGIQVQLPGIRPQAVALSPDYSLLATSGNTQELILIDPKTGDIKQRAALPSTEINSLPDSPAHLLKPDKSGKLSYTGLIFSPDGTRIYLSNVNGDIKVFNVSSTGSVNGLYSIKLPDANAPRRKQAIPAGLAISRDGKRLYVALNLSNRLAEIDTDSGEVLRMWDVGVAPYDVVLKGDKVYVSNWGGRRPRSGDLTGPAGKGTVVRVDPVRYIANEGSVSVVSLKKNVDTKQIVVGLHSSAMALSPNKRYLVVANAGSDTLSVINTKTDKLIETIWVKPNASELFGASPNALTFDSKGNRLYVANGTQNAIAVIEFDPGESEFMGLIPVGWFPGAITYDKTRKRLYVANIKGNGSTLELKDDSSNKYNSRQYHGSISLIGVPNRKRLSKFTRQVLDNYRYPLLKKALQRPRPNQKARPVPQRVGEPSVFEHVIYIIKENRTYDQVLGDIAQGNGNKSLCIFGENITPNQHKMAKEFVLLDNTYCCGTLSADGHQWADTAFATDYMEKSFAGFPRSYPDGMEDNDIDALAYAPSGFIWDNVIAYNKSLRVYGEFSIAETKWKDPAVKKSITFLDYYHNFLNQTDLIDIGSRSAIESLRPYLNTHTVGWNLNIPDVFRAAEFIKELNEYEKKGTLPNMIIICLPNDHTSGTRAGSPTPAAQVADNDLAFGRIVEAVSHSSFWKNTCIFAIEDDPQSGWDHVSGYRTTAYVVSPYTKRNAVVNTQYNQTSIIRTIELILGLPPMNQLDATATPLTDCFTDTPDFTPFTAVSANIPLDQMNPDPKNISNAQLRKDAIASAKLPLDKVDQCPEDVFNRILWNAMKQGKEPYPLWAVITNVDDDDDD